MLDVYSANEKPTVIIVDSFMDGIIGESMSVGVSSIIAPFKTSHSSPLGASGAHRVFIGIVTTGLHKIAGCD